MKEVTCIFCNSLFHASRSDAIRCEDCRNKYLKEYRKRQTTKDRRKEQHKQLRKEAYEGYGHKCDCCGESRFEFLAIDHVNGGGNQERKTKSTGQIARKVINMNFPKEYRLLCHNCNSAIVFFGYCPHKKESTA